MLHIITGNTGSGKTTYCNTLKATTGGVIFSIDFWNNTLFLPDKTREDGFYLEYYRTNSCVYLRDNSKKI